MIEVIIQGVAQGLTEFLPISSSGHIAIIDYMTSQSSDILHTSVVLHAGTLVSLIIFFWNEIKLKVAGLVSWKRESHVFTINIIVATVPIVFVAFSLTGQIDGSYTSDNIVSNILPYTYLLMGIVLFSTRFLPLKGIDNRMGPALALLIGCVQIFAILPGISRAGITISASLMLGLPRKDAAEFSFMIGIPALLGAIVLDLFENGLNISIIDCIGFFVSMIVGYISIYLVFHLLSKSRFWYFSFYCWLVSLISIIIKYQ